jgi:hypothetical protein
LELLMPLKGKGFMILWHDIAADQEADYHLWHTREHMPERLSIPGFTRGRRGVNWSLDFQRYLTIYEGEDLEVFSGAAYLERLNNPTPWTQRMSPAFRNFLRVACETVVSEGLGVGGAVGTYRGLFSSAGEAGFVHDAPTLARRLMALPGVSAVHLAVARPEHSDIRTAETKLRPEMGERPFEGVVVVEAVGLAELDRLSAPIIEQVWGALAEVTAQTYDMAYVLDALPAAAKAPAPRTASAQA